MNSSSAPQQRSISDQYGKDFVPTKKLEAAQTTLVVNSIHTRNHLILTGIAPPIMKKKVVSQVECRKQTTDNRHL